MPTTWTRTAAFPQEAIDALKAEKLLGILVPAALGGEEASVADVVDVCYALGRACSSTGMIYAMHQVKAACVVHHGMDSAWHRDFMARMVADQLLLASSTTEGKGGGNVRSSEAPVEHADGRIVLVRDASVISYGAQADAVVTTARRAADADASDQVLVVFEKKNYALEKTGGWDTLGMRGTCSAGFSLKAVGSPDQILPVPYGAIHSPDHGADLAPDVVRHLGRHRRRRGGAGQEIHAQGAARRRPAAGRAAFHQGAGQPARLARPDRRLAEPL